MNSPLTEPAGLSPDQSEEEEVFVLPASFAQQRLWFLDQLHPGQDTYNAPVAFRLTGPLDMTVLENALAGVIDRHEALRTTFGMQEGEPVQIIAAAGELVLALWDLRAVPLSEREARVRALIAEEVQRPFDLATGPLLRSTVLRLAEAEHIVIFNSHHIVNDDWSVGVFLRDLKAFYEAAVAQRPAVLPELPIQYADFAVWQRDWVKGAERDRQLDYWREHLAQAPVLELPTDHTRQGAAAQRGGMTAWSMPSALLLQLKELSKREGATLFMTVLAAFKVLLHRYTGQTDIVLGTPISNRTRPEIEPLIGFFVNTLVLRTHLDGEPTFREVLARVRDTVLGGFENQDAPFEMLVEELQPERRLNQNPLCQAMFVLVTARPEAPPIADLKVEWLEIEDTAAKFDLTLSLIDTGDGLEASFVYDAALFERATVERLARHFQHLLESVVAEPAQRIAVLPILSEAERHQLLVEWNETRANPVRDICLHHLIEEQVARTPAACALIFKEERLTYREVNERANQLARRLRNLGVGREMPVGIYLERSPEMIIAIIAVLKAGGAYLPLDPSYPAPRLAFMMSDAKLTVVLTVDRLTESLPQTSAQILCVEKVCQESTENLAVEIGPENLAYVIYTSGSTGRPKGTMVSHRAISHHLQWVLAEFPMDERDCMLQKIPTSFDASLLEIFPPLLVGAQLVLAASGEQRDSGSQVGLMVRHGITQVVFGPAMLRLVIEEPAFKDCKKLRRVFCGGELLRAETCAEFFAVLDCELVNCYGPTEFTISATFHRCQRGETSIPIGRPVGHQRVYVLDAARQLAPIGVPGELHLAGSQIATGYLNNEALTAEKFFLWNGERVYRTGDLVRWVASGEVEYLGRLDDQVKLRGFRIELGEIENVLRRAEGVREVVVVLREEVKGEPYLAGYVVAEGAVAEEDLARFLQGRLPEYMVPAAWVFLEALPLNANGKVDRQALPAPERGRGAAQEYVAPATPLEEALVESWEQLLRRERIGVLDNFFVLGGHSLLAIRLVAQWRAAWGIELPLRCVFENQTIRALAACLEELRAAARGEPAAALTPIPRVAGAGEQPLSFAQQRLWFLDRLDPGQSVYNVPAAWRLTGPLQVPALEQALADLVARQEILRTVFRAGAEGPGQWVQPAGPVPLPVTDLRGMPEAEREQALEALFRAEAEQGFDLAQGPVLRARLVRCGEAEQVLMLHLAHIVTDAWSQDIFFRELLAFYEAAVIGRNADLAALPIQYADFAHWQRATLTGAVLDTQFEYWRTQLAGLEPLALPWDHPRVATSASPGAMQPVRLSAAATQALRALSQREGVSLFMTVLAAYQILLARYSGERQIAVGSVISNRSRVETEGLMGFFLNTLVLRTDLGDDPTFPELLQRERAVVLGAFAHQEIPFDLLVERLQPVRVAQQNPLCQVACTLLPGPEEARTAAGVTFTPMEMTESKAKFDLNLHLLEEDGALRGWLIYRTDLFEKATIARMAAHLENLVENLAAQPTARISTLELLAPAERQQLLYQWNDTARPYPATASLPALFAAQVAARPQAIALETEGQTLTYAQLQTQAHRGAQQLRARGVKRGATIGVCLGRSPELIVALLAILEAGGAYVPLDPAYPAERLALMLAEAGVTLVVANAETASLLPADKITLVTLALANEPPDQSEPPGLPSTPTLNGDDLAYIMFTSGSTGPPKGVAVTHRNIIRLVHGTDYADFGPAETFLQLAPISFDAATFEIWGPLLHGGRLVLMPPGPASLADIGAAIRKHSITTLWLTAGLFHAMVEERLGDLQPLRQLLAGGDVLSVPHVRRALAALKNTRLINGYGPTESTTFACCHTITAADLDGPSIPIGRPIANTSAYLLDDHLQPVPIGVTGELFLGGDGLARGYFHRPKLTAERFLPDPFSGQPNARLYRTGDLARFRPNGQIEFLGRRDQQIKLRGFRIELGEIEAALRAHPHVRDAVVLLRQDPDKRLIAYAVAPESSAEELAQFLRSKLPEFSCPAAIILLPVLPLTANGKVDRAALPAPDQLASAAASLVEPRDQLELKLLKIWENALQRHPIGMRDNFFALGGHSLLAVRVFSQIERQLGRNLPLATLFSSPTIEQLAEVLRRDEDRQAWAALVPIQPHGTRPPFFCLHGGDGGVIFQGELANTMDRDIPIFGLQAEGLDGGKVEEKTIEQLAASYLREIKTVQPSGPYHFGGYCFGGVIAFEMARQLQMVGEKVGLVALFDTVNPYNPPRRYSLEERVAHRRREINGMSLLTRGQYLLGRAIGKIVANYNLHFERVEIKWSRLLTKITGRVPVKYRTLAVRQAHLRALSVYQPKPFAGRLTLFRALERADGFEFDPNFGWTGLADEIDVQDISGSHETVFKQPHVHEMAGFLNERLRTAHQLPS